MLAVYSRGHGLPFLLAALFTDALIARLKAFGRIEKPLQLVARSVMIAMGLAMTTGHLSMFAYWLHDVFPALSATG